MRFGWGCIHRAWRIRRDFEPAEVKFGFVQILSPKCNPRTLWRSILVLNQLLKAGWCESWGPGWGILWKSQIPAGQVCPGGISTSATDSLKRFWDAKVSCSPIFCSKLLSSPPVFCNAAKLIPFPVQMNKHSSGMGLLKEAGRAGVTENCQGNADPHYTDVIELHFPPAHSGECICLFFPYKKGNSASGEALAVLM